MYIFATIMQIYTNYEKQITSANQNQGNDTRAGDYQPGAVVGIVI